MKWNEIHIKAIQAALLMVALFSSSASAGVIEYSGTQVWNSEEAHPNGGWYLTGTNIEYYDFNVNNPGLVSFGVNPVSSGNTDHFDPHFAIFAESEDIGISILNGPIDLSPIDLDIGKYVLAITSSPAVSDEFTEDKYNFIFQVIPEHLPNVDYMLTISGDVSTVSEPLTSGLLGLGLAGLGFARRKTAK